MLEEDLARLRPDFTAGELARWEISLLERLGAETPGVQTLLDELVGDLDEQHFGISWWDGHSVHRRILTSDQLVVCTRDIATNIRDARLHHLEAKSGWEGV